MRRLITLAVAVSALGFTAAPASAQEQGPDDKVNTLVVYGDDACPPSTSGEIIVCARMDESERYRIPEALRESGDPANESWVSRVKSFESVGDFGPLSCSTAGAGSELGCTAKFIEAAYQERAQGSDVRFSELIAAARAERLSTIDAEAAETQARVEELERQYMEKVRREEEAAAGGASAAPPPPVPQ
jgi:hypothetical protein